VGAPITEHPEPVNQAAPSPFLSCPVCGSASVMRFKPEWREHSSTIPIVGCGNPWHYDRDDSVAMSRPEGS
jgi:hypothetical protein